MCLQAGFKAVECCRGPKSLELKEDHFLQDFGHQRELQMSLFLRTGCTVACLKSAGAVPVRREVLIMDGTLGARVSTSSLKRRVRIMSR